MPYVKLDTCVLKSTIWAEPDHVRITWITMLLMANPAGRVDATAPGIAHDARLNLQQVREALTVLESPDPDSRSQNDEGRRIERVDGGYQIINFLKYRDKDHTAKDRMRRHREKKKAEGVTPNVTDVTRNVTQAEAEAEAEKTTSPSGEESPAKPTTCPHQQIIDIWHEVLPELPEVRIWNNTRRQHLQSRWREDKRHQKVEFWRGLFEHVRDSDFLMGKTQGRDGRPFRLTLEWLVKPTNFAKVIERHYHDA